MLFCFGAISVEEPGAGNELTITGCATIINIILGFGEIHLYFKISLDLLN